MKSREGYTGLAAGDDSYQADEVSDFADNEVLHRATVIRWARRTWNLACVLMFLSGGAMMLATGIWKPSDRQCAAQLSIWSPLLEAIEYEERDWTSIFATKHSGFTGPPTEQMEAKWKNIVDVPSVVIPSERLPFLNRSVEQGFVSAYPNSPTDGYIAGIEVFHHLHCLNVLRQYIWRDGYPESLIPSLFKFNSPEVAREHADHCVETIRHALMCNADVTPYLLFEVEPEPGSDVPAREDFQAFHKCRNFGGLVDWVKANGVIVPWRQKDKPT